MIRYFRINDPYRLIGLFILLCILYAPQLVDLPFLTIVELNGMMVGEKVAEGYTPYTELIDNTPPLAAWFYGACDWLFGRSLPARHLAAFIILFLQSAFIGVVFIEKKAFTENTYVPSLVFSVLTLTAFEVVSLTADLVAFGFILLALNNLFKQITFREQRDETVTNLGLYLSFASLFVFSYLIFFPAVVVLLILFTRSSIRHYFLLLFGFLLPHMLLVSLYFIFDGHYALIERYYLFNFSVGRSSLLPVNTLFVLCAIPIFYLLLSLVILNRHARLTQYQSQLLQAMFLWFVFALLHAWLAPGLRLQSLLPVLPPVSFLLTYFFLLIRRRKFVELNAWIFVLGVTATGYLSRYEILPVSWSALKVPPPAYPVAGKNVLILDDNPGMWIENRLSPPFVNWELSKVVFDDPDDYQKVLLVNKLFRKDPPQVIIDPQNRMQPFFNRIPGLGANFTKTSNGLWVAVSN
jgi:hypothetical protein